jgi:hypothetical protein
VIGVAGLIERILKPAVFTDTDVTFTICDEFVQPYASIDNVSTEPVELLNPSCSISRFRGEIGGGTEIGQILLVQVFHTTI